MTHRRTPALLFAIALTLALSACSTTGPRRGTVTRTGDIVQGTGTVQYYEIEGGFFAIHGDDDETYDPINLTPEFQHDGLRVRFRAEVRDDMASFHMVGPIVELLEIRRD